MARPIPMNREGLRRERSFNAQPIAPTWAPLGRIPRPGGVAPQRAQAPAAAADAQGPWALGGILLLGVSFLTGGLAVAASVDLLPALAAKNLGLDDRGSFLLLVMGIYLLATTLYAAWQTHLLTRLGHAAWDARLMAYANLGVGGAVTIALGVMALAMVFLALIVGGLLVLLLSGIGHPAKD